MRLTDNLGVYVKLNQSSKTAPNPQTRHENDNVVSW